MYNYSIKGFIAQSLFSVLYLWGRGSGVTHRSRPPPPHSRCSPPSSLASVPDGPCFSFINQNQTKKKAGFTWHEIKVFAFWNSELRSGPLIRWSPGGLVVAAAALRHGEPQGFLVLILILTVFILEVWVQFDACAAPLLGPLDVRGVLHSVVVGGLVKLPRHVVVDYVDPIKRGLAAQAPLSFQTANL